MKLSRLLDFAKSDISDENTRRAEQNDILHQVQKEISTVDYTFILNKKIKVAYIPYVDYRGKIKLIIGDRYRIEKRNNGHISYRSSENRFKIITDKGTKISCNNTPNQQDIKTMIQIALCKGWELDHIKINTNIPSTKKMFESEIQKIKVEVDRAKIMVKRRY